MATFESSAGLPRASVADTIATISEVVLPTLAKGVLIRRPRVVGLAHGLGLDDRAVRRMQTLRRKYGTGPLLLAVPVRNQAIVLDPDDANQVLAGSPDPFMPATAEKRAALAHFEPKVALASRGADRTDRRRFNERLLEPDRAVHTLADRARMITAEEVAPLMLTAQTEGRLTWESFFAAWYRIVRRLVLGIARATMRR